MRNWLAVLALTLGCQGACEPKQDPPAPLSSVQLVPADCDASVQTDDLRELTRTTQALLQRLEPDGLPRTTLKQWHDALGFDPLVKDAWRQMGVAVDQRATLFAWKGNWYLHTRVQTTEDLDTWLQARTQAGMQLESQSSYGWDITAVRAPNQTLLAVARKDQQVVVVPAATTYGKSTGRSPVEALTTLLAVSSEQRLPSQAWARDLHAGLTDTHLGGLFFPGAWMPERKLEGQADAIYQRLRNQLGAVGFKSAWNPDKLTLSLELVSKSDPREPAFVQDLKGATDPLPVVGGLIDPGVLAAGRLSVHPRKFYDLTRSLLPADSRTELDQWVQKLDDTLQIDLIGDVLTNLKGHVVVAVYGFDPELLKASNPTLAFDVLTLKATREAVLVPIHDRKRMERVLNAWTQASKGKLNRQPSGNTLQFAWLDDGALEWAIILADDHILVVDSTAAFDHAIAYERAARPLDAALSDRKLPELFAGVDRSGFYLDASSLANLLAESGNKTVAQWLMPIKSITVTSDAVRDGNRITAHATLSR